MAIITIIIELNSSNSGNVLSHSPLSLSLLYHPSRFWCLSFPFFLLLLFCIISLHDIRSQQSIVLHNWIQTYFLTNWPVMQTYMHIHSIRRWKRDPNMQRIQTQKTWGKNWKQSNVVSYPNFAIVYKIQRRWERMDRFQKESPVTHPWDGIPVRS